MRVERRVVVGLVLGVITLVSIAATGPSAAPTGQMTWAVHFTLAPRWLDPGETEGSITPFLTFYAVHDALLKPMPGGPTTPSLAESWTASPDGLVYDFVLRANAKFHNGEPVTAEDVKFSFERYKGASAQILKGKVKEVRVLDRPARAVPPEGALARLHHLLRHHGDRRRLDRAEEVRRAGRRRRLQEGADRRRPLQGRRASIPASSWRSRPSRATGARRPA